jgi:glycine cleavage system H lipoate-binding protein
VNRDCYGVGWVLKIRPSSADELSTLMSPDEYDEYEKAQA